MGHDLNNLFIRIGYWANLGYDISYRIEHEPETSAPVYIGVVHQNHIEIFSSKRKTTNLGNALFAALLFAEKQNGFTRGQHGGWETDMRTLPAEATFFVNNGSWWGRITEENNQTYINPGDRLITINPLDPLMDITPARVDPRTGVWSTLDILYPSWVPALTT